MDPLELPQRDELEDDAESDEDDGGGEGEMVAAGGAGGVDLDPAQAMMMMMMIQVPPPPPSPLLPQQHPAAAAVAHPPPLPHLLLRRASISSLDESSQKCPESNTLHLSPSPLMCGGSSRPAYKCASHPQRTLEGLHALQKSGGFTDVTLVAGGVEVQAHKSVLSACSPYFRAMFTTFRGEESCRDRVQLQEVDPEALRVLIDYVYTAKVEVNEENVQMLLTAANLLELTDVKDACCDFLLSQLHPTNALGIKAFADLHSCSELLEQAKAYVESHFTEVLECEEFLQLGPQQVVELISSDTITVPSEEKVYESVLEWIKLNVEERGGYLPKLMEHVRLPMMSKDYLLQKVDPEGLFENHSRCKDYIIEALKFHLAYGDPNRLSSFSSSSSSAVVRMRPRQPVGLPKVMLAIGGQAPKAIRSVECYDFKEERWYSVTEMDSRRCRCGVAVVRGKVYAVGGFNGSLRVRTVDEYDPAKDRWTSVASMEARRSTLGVAVLNDHIYAVGGFDGSTGLNSAEVLDLSVASSASGGDCGGACSSGGGGSSGSMIGREWRQIASMSTRRSSVGVGVLCGLIYAVGGYDGNSRHCLSSVEVYSPESDMWTQVADMSARRSGAGVGILHGLLYAVGGHDGPLVRKSVECYNPDKNVWTTAADMNFCRRNAGVVTHNGLLFVVGGDDGTSNLQSVEVYNPKTDTWNMLPGNMGIGRSYTGVCIIDKPDSF